jgi:hypothetical protein
MARPLTMRFAVFVLVLSLAAVLRAADGTAAGQWRVQFVVPSGTKAVNMIVNQRGTKLTGTVVDEYGEFPLDGWINGDQIVIVWSIPDEGKLVDITMKGKLDGDAITGVAQIGNLGEGPLTARRTAEE